ncbi:MAG TPA: DUF6716 putative glycosyltransferase [Lacisediminihabitans sp.]|uniref:DUF6716 putative glycosyltransferase n=1 Tax=Lacisediminihabitans sp. TaxID=2787631 RepID=UPI002EDB4E34
MSGPTRILAIADSDSYVKWGAALLAQAPEDWERTLLVLASPVLPSSDQLDAALNGMDHLGAPTIVDLSALAVRISKTQPDVVLLSVRGPLVKVVVRAVVGAARVRPVIVSGLPGISIPATRKAIAHRAQVDLFVLHSRRETREFSALAERMGIRQIFGLATLPFLPHKSPGQGQDGDVIFAAQAKVPWEKDDRLALLSWLAESARRHPYRRVVVKVRATRGEAQTHAERHDYADLMTELDPPAPQNLVVAGGAMSEHLAGAAALVTISSTAAIEAIALDMPVVIIDDFGVSAALINTVFEGSGLFGNSADIVEGRFKRPNRGWLEDNYFHGPDQDDWVHGIEDLLVQRASGDFELKPLKHGAFGGVLRRAWDRKRALGRFDRSWSGSIALVIGTPARWALAVLRRLKRMMRKPAAARQDDEVLTTEQEDISELVEQPR